MTPGLFSCLTDFLGDEWTIADERSQIIREFKAEYNKGKVIHSSLIDEYATNFPQSEPLPSIYNMPLKDFVSGKKIQKRIQDERQSLQFKVLTIRASKLSVTDPRRMAFFANSTDPFASKLLGSLPDRQVPFSALEWTTAVSCHMGIPVPAIKTYVGHIIRNNRNCPSLRVDPFGHNLSTVAGVLGGGTQRNHNQMAQVISTHLSLARILHLGGATDRSCKPIFHSATPHGDTPRSTDKDVNSIVADLAIINKNNDGPLGLADHLVDIKTLAGGLAYQTNSTQFNNAVSKRQIRVNADYHNTARRLDTRLHNSPAETSGPFTTILNSFGVNGRVLGPVIGIFGEASTDLREIRDLITHSLARDRCDLFHCTIDQAIGLYENTVNRTWGHSIARGWSRLILDRFRDYVCPQSTQHRRDRSFNTGVCDAYDDYNHFNQSQTYGMGSGTFGTNRTAAAS